MNSSIIKFPETNVQFNIGTIISYQDAANPYSESVLVEQDGNKWITVNLETLRIGQVWEASVLGAGGHNMAGYNLPVLASQALYAAAQAKRELDRQERLEAAEKKRKEDEARKQELDSKIPEWAKGAIIAELIEDKSDLMCDYYGSSVVKTVILGYSKHTRNIFSEMRKFAKLSDNESISILADKEESEEHRENYSMGHGMYITKKGQWRHSNGWQVRKVSGYKSDRQSLIDCLV